MTGFYATVNSPALRFGDIVRGFSEATPEIHHPLDTSIVDYSLKVINPEFSVLISPCCSIGDKVVSLVPLIKIDPNFLKNPYFVADLTNINRPMEPMQTVTVEMWNNFPPHIQQERLAAGVGYTFLEKFIYAPHTLLPNYVVSKSSTATTNFYMINFKHIFKVDCNKVINSSQFPPEIKHLELSIRARTELREKIANYFGRTPVEDEQTMTA